MLFWLDTLNFWFAVAGLVMIPVTAFLFIDYFFLKSTYYKQWVHAHVWLLIMTITIGSVVISLVYSEYFGFVPCSLCWLQRIALYPQALLSILAFRLKDGIYFPLYGIAVSVFGLAVALYQYAYQLIPQDAEGGFMPCLADGSADCAVRVIDEFGFMTFPLLSALTFLLLIVLYLHVRRIQKIA
jgi:disulfide bond formation protein DsbB